MTTATWDKHPAPFSDKVLDTIEKMIYAWVEIEDDEGNVVACKTLDPFAGTGKIFDLAARIPALKITGVEIEPEGVAMRKGMVLGDATALPRRWKGRYRLIITSPCYGTRMADHHDAQERCKACKGTGSLGDEKHLVLAACLQCGGTGRREYKRLTYKHTLGHDLHPNNAGAMQWGPEYRDLHERAWREAYRVLEDPDEDDPWGPFLILNISDHVRKGEIVKVTKWHVDTLKKIGFRVLDRRRVRTPRMGFGQNRDARAPFESVILFEKVA